MPPDSAVVRPPPWVIEGAAARGDDPTLEILEGPRAVEVTTLLGDSVLAVRQLRARAGTGIGLGAWALLVAGGAAVTAGGWLQQQWWPGPGALAVLLGVALLVLGGARARRQGRSPHFLVGSARGETDLCLDDPALPAARFPVVRSRPWGHELLFAPGMQGQVQLGSKTSTLAELRRGGQAWPSPKRPGVWCWPIPRGGRAVLRLGPVTLLIRSLAPSRRLPRRLLGEGKRTTAPYLVGALVLHALPLTAGLTAPLWWEGGAARAEERGLGRIQARVLIQRHRAAREQPPPGVPVRGAAQRLPESERGQVHVPSPGHPSFVRSEPLGQRRAGLYGLRGPINNPDPHLARRLAADAAANKGVLALLSRQEAPMGIVTGNQLIGPLPGGWGQSAGAEPLRGLRAPATRLIGGQPAIRGVLGREVIRRVIRRHINEIKYCYQRELQVSPALATKIVLSFTIGREGRVVSARISESSGRNPRVERCIVRAARRWKFPRPRPSGIVMVSYPFVIKTAGS